MSPMSPMSRMTPTHRTAPGLHALAFCALLLPALAGAQAPQRDPMQPPAALRPAATPGSLAAGPALPDSAQVLIVDGKAYALIGSRRYAAGTRIGSGPDALLVERVNEHGVWLRSRDGLHALPMLSGVSKKPSPESGSPDKSQEKRDRP